MKRLFLFFIYSISLISSGFSQDNNQEDDVKGSHSRPTNYHRVAIKMDYFGEVVLHPGLTIGIEYSLKENDWVNLHWDTEIGGYYHKWNHTGLLIKSSIGTRVVFPFAFLIDLNLGVGYLHTFPQGNVYIKDEKGGVVKDVNWGSPHFMPTTSLLIGWDGAKNRELPVLIHLGIEAYLESSFNQIFLPHAALKVGVVYKLKKKHGPKSL